MNVWIITTGSSDVQLNTKDHWTSLFRNVRSELGDRSFNPTEGTDNRFLAPARVMGTVYSQPQAEQHWGDFTFPLLDNFVRQIQNQAIDQIILILTDQTDVFHPSEQRSQQCPYWQDTRKLEPILTKYLKDKDKFPDAELRPLFLKPMPTTKGLDDWDYVLRLVQEEFAHLDFPNGSTIYVSHQAGTPAISSAIQFSSLTKFAEQVKFLVSSERDSKLTRILDSSTYLRGIRLQEAKALLKRHDYSGVKALLNSSLKPEVEILLDAAIQWNFAKFDEFAKKLLQYSDNNFAKEVQERTKKENWWWTAYESAYLGVVRLNQGNTVEAMFHSFRAVEGLLAKWVDKNNNSEKQGKKFTKQGGKKRKKIKLSHRVVLPWGEEKDEVNAYGQGLYLTLDFFKGVDKTKDTDIDIWTFGNFVFDARNGLFHHLEGLQDKESVFKAWEISTGNEQEWKDRVLGCLNFVSEEAFKFLDREELDGTVASLMVTVHEKLKTAIANYEHTP